MRYYKDKDEFFSAEIKDNKVHYISYYHDATEPVISRDGIDGIDGNGPYNYLEGFYTRITRKQFKVLLMEHLLTN